MESPSANAVYVSQTTHPLKMDYPQPSNSPFTPLRSIIPYPFGYRTIYVEYRSCVSTRESHVVPESRGTMSVDKLHRT